MTEHFDPAETSADVRAATDRLLRTARTLSDDDVPAPSLLPGWSRGHVLTHLARGADAMCNVLSGVTTGVEKPAYPSQEARDAAIEAGAARPIAQQIADVETSFERFHATVAAVPAHEWETVVAFTLRGDRRPVRAALDSRVREIAIHHVDLDAGYTAADWPPDFALRILHAVLPVFEARAITPCTLRPTDAPGVVPVAGGAGLEISGPTHALATWLLGRTDGSSLQVTGGDLPAPPVWT